MKKITKTILLMLSIMGLLCLIPCLLPKVQHFAIEIVEKYKNDDINNLFWMQQMFAFASLGIIFILIFNAIIFTKKGKDIFFDFYNSLKEKFALIKSNKKYFFILIGLYFLGYLSIFRANFWNYAIDDLPRIMEGSREWVNFYRYFAEIGSIFIHASLKIFDIAPLTQFIALIFIAIASFFVISIFTNNRFSIFSCIASIPIGLFPFFLSNFSYRYDSPYMALSLCISIIPFLFVKEQKNFIISSIICLLIMCTSYQASSGIYIFMAVLIFIKQFIIEKSDSKFLIKFTITSICCYAITLLFFSFLFIEQAQGGSYVDESMNLSMIIPNTITYLQTLFFSLKKSSIFLFTIFTLALLIVNIVNNTKISKIITIFVVFLGLCFCIPMTFGSYLALGRPEFIPRTCIGIGVFIGCISVINTSFLKENSCISNKVTKVITFCLSYCLLTFAFAFGNAQYDQKEYIRFRGTILAQDLSEIVSETNEDVELLFLNNIGLAPSAELLNSICPFVTEAVDFGLRDGRGSQFILKSLKFCKLKEKPNHDFRNKDLPLLKETAYHKIQGEGNYYLITFKNPDFTVIKTRRFISE